MIRFTWRQIRGQAIGVASALVIVGLVVVITGLRMTSLYHSLLTAGCAPKGCLPPGLILDRSYGPMRSWLSVAALGIPAIIGVFWGAPVVAREFETGTHRLAWTQSITRQRWLAVKLAVLGLASMAAAGLFTLMTTWWLGTYNDTVGPTGGRFVPGQFEVQGIVPAGYAALAFAAAVTAGVLIRRTVPAMAAGLAAFAAIRYALRYWVRPYLASPVTLKLPLTYGGGPAIKGSTSAAGFTVTPTGPPLPGAWVYSARVADAARHAPTQSLLRAACPTRQPLSDACTHGLASRLHNVIVYQPASRFWLFQSYETAICLGIAAALALFCGWWIGHHRSTLRPAAGQARRLTAGVPG